MNDISQFLLAHGGPVLFASVLAEEAGLPLPAAPWLLAAGALAASGTLNPALAMAMATLACLVADSAWFYVGRQRGQRVLRLFCKLSISPNSCVGSSKGFFARHGEQGLLVAKFIPVLGGVMPPLAGALGMSTARFLAYDGLGSILYGGAYIAVGYMFHNQLLKIGTYLNRLGLSVLLLSGVLALGYIAFRYIRRRRASSGQTLSRHRSIASSKAADEIVRSGGEAPQLQVLFPVASLGPISSPLPPQTIDPTRHLRASASSAIVQPIPSYEHVSA